MTETGILVTLPGGSRFWHRCPAAPSGAKDIALIQAETRMYGPAFDDPATVVEFGEVGPDNRFVAKQRIRPAALAAPQGK